MVLQIYSYTIKLQKVTYAVIFCNVIKISSPKHVIKMTSQKISIFKPLSKILVALLGVANRYVARQLQTNDEQDSD